ncbi:hypothetical protein RFI_16759 [Reticulomyxa filosa]|uniref:Uncharacterized protein n=1 Tax=Reticulomyxa filosa TaxID=46433 RepID=X6N3J8_RETFI|nr:hypothetical protein RFI_16759 [Reticulomyxa filosa]|eukprot:ETO20458.1 hypothetical protein RFI_16759 [Reticulomyxa filosa]
MRTFETAYYNKKFGKNSSQKIICSKNKISVDWQKKYKNLSIKFKQLQVEHEKLTTIQREKIKVLQSEIKYVVHHMGEKLEKLETTLLWYRKKCIKLMRHQTDLTSQNKKHVNNHSTQTIDSCLDNSYLLPFSETKSASKTNDNKIVQMNDKNFKGKKVQSQETDKASESSSPQANNFPYEHNEFSTKRSYSSKNFQQKNVPINVTTSYFDDEIAAQHNAVIAKLRARLDAMNEILILCSFEKCFDSNSFCYISSKTINFCVLRFRSSRQVALSDPQKDNRHSAPLLTNVGDQSPSLSESNSVTDLKLTQAHSDKFVLKKIDQKSKNLSNTDYGQIVAQINKELNSFSHFVN